MKTTDWVTLGWLVAKLVIDSAVVMYLIARLK